MGQQSRLENQKALSNLQAGRNKTRCTGYAYPKAGGVLILSVVQDCNDVTITRRNDDEIDDGQICHERNEGDQDTPKEAVIQRLAYVGNAGFSMM